MWASIFALLDKIMGKLPIQDRKERWKNEIDNLTKERKELINGKYTAKKGDRVIAIDLRISYLNQLLKNSSDSK